MDRRPPRVGPRPSGGRVYLVGAGPGDPGMLTLRAWEVIGAAEVVLHDALVSEAILELLPEGAERIDVGKRAGRHKARQERIAALLVDHARRGRVVVRLKGGDPLVFGRGAEEMAALRGAGIPYELVPGVTSAVAAPACAGIPVTHRELSGAVTFVTGHDAATGRGPVAWNDLAASDHTLVVLMGLGRLEAIAARLLAAGRPADTPAAVISRAATVHQRVVTGTLATIAREARASGVEPPATVVVGRVAALAATLAWRPTVGAVPDASERKGVA